MRALTTKKEREVVMEQLREVSKLERVCFPVVVTILCILLLPAVAPLIGMLMLGNIFKESGRGRTAFVHGAECDDQYRYDLSWSYCRGYSRSGYFFESRIRLRSSCWGLMAFIFSTIGGSAAGKTFMLAVGWKDQSSDRIGRGIRSSDGSTCVPGRRSKGQLQ